MAQVAIGFGASIIAFISLAFQVVQGSRSFYELLDEAKNAHHKLSQYEKELNSFQSTIRAIKKASEYQRLVELVDEPLRSSEIAVTQLANLIGKYQPYNQLGWWGCLKVALGANKLTSALNALREERSKISFFLKLEETKTLRNEQSSLIISANTTMTSIRHVEDDIKYLHARFDQLNSAAVVIQREFSYSLASDMRLSSYNIVPLNAPIAIACRDANIEAAVKLFKAGSVTFHDRIFSIETSQKISLIDYTWSHFMNTIEGINSDRLQKLFQDESQIACLGRYSEMIKFLVAAIDPSDQSIIAYTFIGDVWELIAEDIFHHPVMAAYFQEVVRTFLSQRGGCPFGGPTKSQREFLRETSSIFRDIAASPKEELWAAQSATIIAKSKEKLDSVAAALASKLGLCSLRQDPDANYIKYLQQYGFKDQDGSKLAAVCTAALQSSQLLDDEKRENFDAAIKERLQVYLKHGNLADMKTLCHKFGEADKIELLKLAWGEAGREPKALHDILVEERLD